MCRLAQPTLSYLRVGGLLFSSFVLPSTTTATASPPSRICKYGWASVLFISAINVDDDGQPTPSYIYYVVNTYIIEIFSDHPLVFASGWPSFCSVPLCCHQR